MQTKGFLRVLAIVSLLPFSTPATAEPKDPRTRNEDLSATTVDVNVDINSAGLYVYVYNIKAGGANTGKISEFAVDISCDDIPDPKDFSPSDFPTRSMTSASPDGKHVPVALDAPEGHSFQTGVAASNEAMWSVMLEPSERATGLKIISPYPPGSRRYTLYPSVDYNMDAYDYEGIDPEDPTIPWINEWTAYGITTGPTCLEQE